MGELLGAVRQARLGLLAVSWFLTLIGFWVLSFKMRLILEKQGSVVDTATIFGVSAVTTLYSMVLPGLLDTTVKWYMLKDRTGQPSNVLSSMLYNQFTSTIVMVIVTLVTLIGSNLLVSLQLFVICSTLLVIIVIGSVVLLNRRVGPKLTGYLSAMLKPLPRKVRKVGQKVLGQLSVFQTAGWRFHFNSFFLSVIAMMVGGIFVFFFSAKTAGIDVPISALVYQCSLVFILGRLPITVGNLGVREVALVESLAVYDVDAQSALLMSLAILSNRVFFMAIGLVYHLIYTFRDNNVLRKGDK